MQMIEPATSDRHMEAIVDHMAKQRLAAWVEDAALNVALMDVADTYNRVKLRPHQLRRRQPMSTVSVMSLLRDAKLW